MTDDELALLRTIREHPDADLPRLVYADWLEERGDADRAEFIRLQIERHARTPDPTARGIGPREYQLLLAHEREWKDELPPGFRDGAAFRRGLIHRVRCRAASLYAEPAWPILAPVEELHVVIAELSAEWLIAPPPALTLPLRELTVDCEIPVGAILAEALVRFGPFPHLHTLRILGDPSFGEAGVLALRPLPAFPSVRHLDLSGCGIAVGPHDPAPDFFARAGWTDRLDRLTLGGVPVLLG